MTKKIQKQCLACNKMFLARSSEVNRGNGRYCSIDCGRKSRTLFKKERQHNCHCAFCNKTFYRNNTKQKASRSGLQFCNRLCKEKAQKLGGIKEIQPEHYGKGVFDYRKFALEQKPHVCEKCGYNKIPQILEVHHKDRNRKNNDILNLQILCSRCHDEEHYLTNTGKWLKKFE
jgi:hypothetical protein